MHNINTFTCNANVWRCLFHFFLIMHSILQKKSLYHKYIVLTGPERCLVDYVLSDRRSGRNEEQAHDVAIYRGHQLAQCDLNIQEFVKANECIRNAIFKHFNVDIESVTPVQTVLESAVMNKRTVNSHCHLKRLVRKMKLPDLRRIASKPQI